MNYCTEEKGMNQPLTIQPNQVTSNQPFNQTTPPGDINPTTTTPGLNFPSTNPLINITLDQPAALTVIYVPTDRPNQPTNVKQFVVVFVYPNGTTSEAFLSQIPSTSGTTNYNNTINWCSIGDYHNTNTKWSCSSIRCFTSSGFTTKLSSSKWYNSEDQDHINQ